MKYNIEHLGQVFTPEDIVHNMINLIQNNGKILEPSCGDGAFSNHLDCDAIEIDKSKCPDYAINIDFFNYDIKNTYDTIIGNPPYVRFQDINQETKDNLDMNLFSERANLYLFFIHKSIQHLNDGGELIFIVPRDFLKATSSIKLNQYIYEQGTITHMIDLGDNKVFKGFSPNCVIFRFEKGNYERLTNDNRQFKCINGQLLLLDDKYSIPFSDLFYVKVGAVSGADKCFTHTNGNKEFVYSKTRENKQTKRMFYNIKSDELLPYKDKLLERRIKKFNEGNWYHWGRNLYESDKQRIYVNCKTRKDNPFFTHHCTNYDGSILGIFPKHNMDIEKAIDMLNEVNWEELGFICDGRYLFSQRALENCLLPNRFNELSL